MKLDGYRRHTLEARALDLLDHLCQTGGSSKATAKTALGWTDSQFTSAVDYVRTTLAFDLGVTIPHPVPDDGYKYRATGDWIGVDGRPAIEAGTSYAIGQIEARLHSVHRDVQVAKRNLDARSLLGRKLNYLDKHLGRIFADIAQIGGSTVEPTATSEVA